jgi:hypothetical protein
MATVRDIVLSIEDNFNRTIKDFIEIDVGAFNKAQKQALIEYFSPNQLSLPNVKKFLQENNITVLQNDKAPTVKGERDPELGYVTSVRALEEGGVDYPIYNLGEEGKETKERKRKSPEPQSGDETSQHPYNPTDPLERAFAEISGDNLEGLRKVLDSNPEIRYKKDKPSGFTLLGLANILENGNKQAMIDLLSCKNTEPNYKSEEKAGSPSGNPTPYASEAASLRLQRDKGRGDHKGRQ